MIFDLHNDILTFGYDEQTLKNEIERLSTRVKGVILAFWSTKSKGLPFFDCKIANIYRAIEDLHFYSEKCEEDILSFNPIYCSLTWNYDNSLAGGALDGGLLTGEGECAIRFLNKNNIIVDVAHLNRRSFFEVIECAEKVVCSHTAVEALKSHLRNLTDEQIRIIIQKGGVIGLTPVRAFVKGNGGVVDFTQTIDYCVQRFGVEHFCIATDYYGSTDFDENLSRYDRFGKLKAELFKLGYTKKDIDSLFYQNATRLFL